MKGGHALIRGDWKLITHDQGKPALFNLATDPYEKQNLAAQEPQRVTELKSLLADQRAKDNPTLPPDLKGQPD